MADRERHDVYVAHLEWLVRGEDMKVNLRDAGIFHFGKEIGIGPVQACCRLLVCKDIDVSKLAVRSQVVQSSDMVVMDMCEQHCVYPAKRLSEHLLPEVRPAVYQDSGGVGLHQCTATQAFVLRHVASARVAVAA